LVFPFRRGGRPFRRRVRNAVEHPPWLFKRSDQFLSRWIVSFRLSSRLASPRLTSPFLCLSPVCVSFPLFPSFSLFFSSLPPPLSLSLSPSHPLHLLILRSRRLSAIRTAVLSRRYAQQDNSRPTDPAGKYQDRVRNTRSCLSSQGNSMKLLTRRTAVY